jgi:hypothetical protein
MKDIYFLKFSKMTRTCFLTKILIMDIVIIVPGNMATKSGNGSCNAVRAFLMVSNINCICYLSIFYLKRFRNRL